VFPIMLHMVRFYDGGIHRMGPIIKTSQTPALSEGSSFEGHEAPHRRLAECNTQFSHHSSHEGGIGRVGPFHSRRAVLSARRVLRPRNCIAGSPRRPWDSID
jgi:hypothetical protein